MTPAVEAPGDTGPMARRRSERHARVGMVRRHRNSGRSVSRRQIVDRVVTMPGMKNFSSYGLGESFVQGEC